MKRYNCALIAITTLALIVACGKKTTEETIPTDRSAEGGRSAMQIEVLTIPGCQITPPTVDLVKATADGMGVTYDIEIVTVESHQEANDLKFIGSPSVRINGEDIDPDAHLQKQYGVT